MKYFIKVKSVDMFKVVNAIDHGISYEEKDGICTIGYKKLSRYLKDRKALKDLMV